MLERVSYSGHQHKYRKDGWWYKRDVHGYESLAEVVCSELNEQIGVSNFVRYYMHKSELNGLKVSECKSRDFMLPGYKLFTLEQLANIFPVGRKLLEMEVTTPEDTIKRFVDNVFKLIGYDWVVEYLLNQMWLDCLYFNIDRHINNIAFLVNEEDVKPCPYFDFGESLMSDLRIFKEDNVEQYIARCLVPPFKFTVPQMVVGLRHISEYPYSVPGYSNYSKRIQSILSSTWKLIS